MQIEEVDRIVAEVSHSRLSRTLMASAARVAVADRTIEYQSLHLQHARQKQLTWRAIAHEFMMGLANASLHGIAPGHR
jgi:hypothetical protein